MSAATDFLDTRDAYAEAAERVHELGGRILDPSATADLRAELVPEFWRLVQIAEPLQERPFSGEMVAAAAAEFEPAEVPPAAVERDEFGRTAREAAWGSPGGRLAQLERDRRDRARPVRTISSRDVARYARRQV